MSQSNNKIVVGNVNRNCGMSRNVEKSNILMRDAPLSLSSCSSSNILHKDIGNKTEGLLLSPFILNALIGRLTTLFVHL